MKKLLAASLLTALTACAPEDPGISYAEGNEPGSGSALKADEVAIGGTQGDDMDPCQPNRLIAYSPQGDCPDAVDGWAAAPLFAFDDQGAQAAMPEGLDGLCLYEWGGDGQPSQAQQRPMRQRLGDMTGVGPDCRVGAPLGDTLAAQIGPQMRAAFQTAINSPANIAGNPEKVRVAVVDTSPRNGDSGRARSGQSSHGLSVGRIIRAKTCASDGGARGACVGHIAHHLGLPRVEDSRPNYLQGGFFGLQSDPAVAIVAAVRDWRAAQGEDEGQNNLVINLSLGWDGEFGGPLDPALPPEDQLVGGVLATYKAIEYAACSGALIVAAAGNDTGGLPVPTGPMYPAAWEQMPAPDAGRCALYNLNPPAGGPGYQPLLHSVGGVDGADAPLSNSREAGQPRAVAPGFQAGTMYLEPGSGLQPTKFITGSSAAAATFSGAAALVWGYRPNLSANQVAEVVYASGVTLDDGSGPMTPDYCQGASCAAWPVTRVSLCGAVKAACKSGASTCPADVADFDCDATPAAYSGANLQLTEAEILGAINAIKATDALDPSDGVSGVIDLRTTSRNPTPATVPTNHGADARCGGVEVTAQGAPQTNICADRQAHDSKASPWVAPQPGADPCPDCYALSYTLNGYTYVDLTIDIDTAYDGYDLEDATFYANGNAIDLYSYGLGTVSGYTSKTLYGIYLGKNVSLSSAKLTFQSYDATKAGCATSSALAILDVDSFYWGWTSY